MDEYGWLEGKLQKKQGKCYVWDMFRKKWVRLTSEEFVRQHTAYHLVEKLGYPKSLVKLEGCIRASRQLKRADIVVYNRKGQAFIVVECKSPVKPLQHKVLMQTAQYNIYLKAPFLLITNGLQYHCWKVDHINKTCHPLQELPRFDPI